MREREEVFDHFITAVINTLNADEIYDAAIEALQDILQPDGLLLMMNQNTHHVFSVIRKCGSIACTKSYSVPTDSMLQELKDSPNLIMLNDTGKHILDLLTPRQRNWLNAEHITAIYTLKYNQVIIGFLYIAAHDGQDFAPEELRYLEKICYYSSYALRNANLYQNAYRASITDDLTSLYNRKHAFECIDHVCQHQKPSTLIVLDIDDFKLYNELYGAQENDFNYYKACALSGLGRKEEATELFLAASIGNSQPAAAMYYNDQKPDKIFYQGLALRKLEREEEARGRFNNLISYGEKHLYDVFKMDYFAVSLPDLQIWEDDMNKKNRIHCNYLMALGHLGLGNNEKAMKYFDIAAEMDNNHQGVQIHQKMI